MVVPSWSVKKASSCCDSPAATSMGEMDSAAGVGLGIGTGVGLGGGVAVGFCHASTQCEPLGERGVRHGLTDGRDSGCSVDRSVASVVVSTVLGSSANE